MIFIHSPYCVDFYYFFFLIFIFYIPIFIFRIRDFDVVIGVKGWYTFAVYIFMHIKLNKIFYKQHIKEEKKS